MRVHELVEPRQRPNNSLQERSPPCVRVQEAVESHSPMDELRHLAAELNRRLELVGHGGGPSDGRYPVQTIEQGMPSVARSYATIQPHDPDARFYISSGDPYGQAYCNSHGLYPDETPANCSARFALPGLTESSTFVCRGLEPRQTVFRNTLDRR